MPPMYEALDLNMWCHTKFKFTVGRLYLMEEEGQVKRESLGFKNHDTSRLWRKRKYPLPVRLRKKRWGEKTSKQKVWKIKKFFQKME